MIKMHALTDPHLQPWTGSTVDCRHKRAAFVVDVLTENESELPGHKRLNR